MDTAILTVEMELPYLAARKRQPFKLLGISSNCHKVKYAVLNCMLTTCTIMVQFSVPLP